MVEITRVDGNKVGLKVTVTSGTGNLYRRMQYQARKFMRENYPDQEYRMSWSGWNRRTPDGNHVNHFEFTIK